MSTPLPSNRRSCEVLLVHPPWFRLQNSCLVQYPPGPCYIAAALEQDGIDALVWNGDFDPNTSISVGGTNILKTDELTRSHERYLARLKDLSDPIWKEAEGIIRLTTPKVIGISAYSATYQAACNVARIAKQCYPGVPVVMGGIHASIAPEDCLLKCPDIDVVVMGEADHVAGPLFKMLMTNGVSPDLLAGIPGAVYRKDGAIVKNARPEPIQNLDELPLPARHRLIDLDQMPPLAHQSLFGFRGCPFQCIFCGSFNVFGRKPRMRSADSLVHEIETVYKQFGTHYYYICDDIFLWHRPRVERFIALLRKKRLPVYYSIQTRGEMLQEDLLRKLKKTGCQHIAVGIEVGDEEIRTKIKKGNTVADMRRAAELIRKTGLRMSGFFMFGFPWETREQMLKTADLMEELNPTVAFPYIATPALGTELFAISQEMGLLGDHLDCSSFHHESPKMGLTTQIPEAERKVFIDSILDRFAEHNRKSLRGDIFRRPKFYFFAARDAGILSSWKHFTRHLRLLFAS